VPENRVLRGIFGPKGKEATEGERELHNEELHNFYSSQNIIRIIKIKETDTGEACSTHGRNGI
jgi:hypothetical protein